MLLQASTGIRPRLPANWLISAKDGAVKSGPTPFNCAGAKESNCGLRCAGLTAVAVFPLPKIGAAQQGEGREYAKPA